MAYMDQKKKAIIAAALKEVVPADWKYSLRVRDRLAIQMVIKSAPVDLIGESKVQRGSGYVDVNIFHPQEFFTGERLGQMIKIIVALNTGNHDRSDSMIDYFDVGHYVDLQIGEFNKPFVVKAV